MRKLKFKFMDKEEKNVEMVHLSPYMKSVIERLTADKKRPAVHTYNATLNSFTKFFGGQGTEEMLVTDVFTDTPTVCVAIRGGNRRRNVRKGRSAVCRTAVVFWI